MPTTNWDTAFFRAISLVPAQTRWLHHGRNYRDGLDCVGLILLVYRYAGLPIDALDLPYGERDCNRLRCKEMFRKQLAKRFDLVGPACDAFRPAEPLPAVESEDDCKSGDVLIVGMPKDGHIGIVIAGNVYEMTVRKLSATPIEKVWPWVASVYRHRTVIG